MMPDEKKPEEQVKRDPVQRRLYLKVVSYIPHLKILTKVAIIKALLVSMGIEKDDYDN